MTGVIWIEEAERLQPAGTAGTMSGVGGPRATLHCTVSQPGSFNAMHRTLVGKKAEPHLLYDPATDRLGQYFPLDRSARALLGAPTVSPSHNKAGTVNIQVEVCAMPDDWTEGWTPGPNFKAMMRAIASWGIRPEFVFRLPKNGSKTERDAVARPRSVVNGDAGGGVWWGHCHYPNPEVHWDPGPINEDRFFEAAQEDDMPSVKEVADAILDAKVVPATMLGEREQLVAIPRSMELAMRWALEARDNAIQARKLAEAAALKGSALTPDEVKSAVKEALSEAAQIDVVVRPGVAQ